MTKQILIPRKSVTLDDKAVQYLNAKLMVHTEIPSLLDLLETMREALEYHGHKDDIVTSALAKLNAYDQQTEE